MSKFFSVVIPIYNVEKYIKQCVDSLLSQTFQDFEIILVDDGSPDEAPLICDKYALLDDRIKVIHKENGGLVEARKSGVELAEGDYVICIDGDDWIENTYLEEFEHIISEYNVDIVCCGYYMSFDYENKKEYKLNVPSGYYDRERIIKEVFPCLIEDEGGRYFPPMIWAKAYRRELYKQQQQQVPGIVGIGEDHACTKPCIYYANSLFVLDKYLYHYRQNPESMTKKPKPFSWEGPKIIGQHFEKCINIEEYDFQEQVYRNIVHNLFNVACSQFNKNDSYANIKDDILEHIKEPYNWNAICNCKYKHNLKGGFARIALRYQLIRLMLLYNRFLKKI